MQFRAVSKPSDAVGELTDATMQFRALSESSDAIGELPDATMQFPRSASRPTRSAS